MFNLWSILGADILPSVNGTFWSTIGSAIVNFFVMLLHGLAVVGYTLVKFALNIIDFMQLLVQKLAGIESWMNLSKLNLDNLQETDVVFRFLLSDTVLKVFRTMFMIFIVLLILFTIVAIVKNEYSNAVDSADNNHKKSLYTAVKAILTVVIIPFILIVGILSSNAILASLAKAFNINGNLSISGQVYVASAYDASMYRKYATEDKRKFVSNRVNFSYTNADGTYVNAVVSSAITPITPKEVSESKPFTGFMFTHNGTDYYLFQCSPEESEHYYNYIKYILGAYIVELIPQKLDGAQFLQYNQNATNQDNNILNLVKDKYQALSNKMGGNVKGGLPVNKGYFSKDLHTESGKTDFISAAYNTWSYNQMLNTSISTWYTQNASLVDETATFSSLNGQNKDARMIKNSDAWGKLHDGGKNGFAPLAVEYLAMADVVDFMIGNGVTLYFVNSTNSNINWYVDGFDYGTRYSNKINDYTVETGLLVDYKTEGRVAYQSKNTKSELDGAIYIVCYYNPVTNKYVPLVNGRDLVDSKGNRYAFSSGQYAADYHGAVIARALFNKNTYRNCEPTYISATMVADGTGDNDFDSKLKVATQLDIVDTKYNYLSQLTDVNGDNVDLKQTINDGSIFYSYDYYSDGAGLSIYSNKMVEGYDYEIERLYDYMYKEYVTEDNKEIFKAFILDNIAVPIANFITDNATDGTTNENNKFELFDSAAKSIILETDETGFTGNIIIELKKSGDNPQKHIIRLSLFQQSKITSDKDGDLCKIDFRFVSYINGENQNVGLIKIDAPQNELGYIPEYDRFIATNGSNLSYYVQTDDYLGNNNTNNDELFYEDSGDILPNFVAIEDLIERVVGSLTNTLGDSKAVYSIVAENGQNYAVDTANQQISFVVYKQSDTEPASSNLYNNTAKFVVTLNVSNYDYIEFTETEEVENEDGTTGEQVIIATYRIYDITTSITKYAEQFDFQSANNVIDKDYAENELFNFGSLYNDILMYFADSSLFDATNEEQTKENAANIAVQLAKLYFNNNDNGSEVVYDYSAFSSTKVEGNITNGLEITFDVRVYTNKDLVKYLTTDSGLKVIEPSTTTSPYYVVRFTLSLNWYQEFEDTQLYQYGFSVSHQALNTFNMYSDTDKSANINNVINDTYRIEGDNNIYTSAITVDDLTYKGWEQYNVAEPNEDYNGYTIHKFSYSKTVGGNNVEYIFNAIYSGVDADDGYSFICIDKSNADNNSWKDVCVWNEEFLVYKLGVLRNLSVSDYSFVSANYSEDGKTVESYDIYFVDVENTTEGALFVYILNLDSKINSLPYKVDEGGKVIGIDENSVTVKRFVIGNDKLENDEVEYAEQNKTRAAEYIYERISLDLYEVGLDQYTYISQTSNTNIYTVNITANTGEIIILNAVDVHAFKEKPIYDYFNDNLIEASIAGTYLRKIAPQSKIIEQLKKVLNEPTTIIFCRDELSTNFMFDIELHLFSWTDGFDFRWRSPKFGFAQALTHDGLKDNAVIKISRGALLLDYNFSGNVKLQNIYEITDLNWIILVFAVVLILNILGTAVWGLVKRIYEITLLFLIMPAVASTLPLDSKGDKFGKWKSQLIGQVLGAWGVTIGLNFFFIIVPVIRSASAIFTDADVANLSSSVKFFVRNADRLNSLVYILFLLVAFTLLKTVPKMISEFVGGNDVISQGADVKKAATETVNDVSKSMTGANAVKKVKGIKEGLDKGSFVPGSAIVDAAKKGKVGEWIKKHNQKKNAEKDNEKDKGANSEAEAIAKENERIAEQKRQEQLDKAKELADRRAALNGVVEAPNGENEPANDLSEEGKDRLKDELKEEINKVNEKVDLLDKQLEAEREADKLKEQLASGNVHDYYGDMQREAAKQKAQELADAAKDAEDKEAERKREKQEYKANGGRRGEKARDAVTELENQIKTQEELSKTGKGKRAKLDYQAIQDYNERHKNDKDFTALVSRDHKDYNSDEQKNLRIRAAQEQKTIEMQNELALKKEIAEDAKNGIYRGARGSFVRGIISGKKTTEERVKDAQKVEEAEKALDKAKQDKTDTAKLLAEFKTTKDKDGKEVLANISEENIDSMTEKLLGSAEGKVAKKAYDEYMESQGGRTDARTRTMALNEARKAVQQSHDANADKRIKEAEKALEKAQKRANDDHRGLGHATTGRFGRFVGGMVAAKAKSVKDAMHEHGELKRARKEADKQFKEDEKKRQAQIKAELKDKAKQQGIVNALDAKNEDSFAQLLGTSYAKKAKKAYKKAKESGIAERFAREHAVLAAQGVVEKQQRKQARKDIKAANKQTAKDIKANNKQLKNDKKAEKKQTKADLKDKELQQNRVLNSHVYEDLLGTSYAKKAKKAYKKAAKTNNEEMAKKLAYQNVTGKLKNKIAEESRKETQKQHDAAVKANEAKRKADAKNLRNVSGETSEKLAKEARDKFTESRAKAGVKVAESATTISKTAEQKLIDKLDKKAITSTKLNDKQKADIKNLVNKVNEGKSLTDAEKKRFDNYANKLGAARKSKSTAADNALAKNAGIVDAAYRRNIDKIRRDIANSSLSEKQKREIDKQIADGLKKSKVLSSEVNKLVKQQLNKEINNRKNNAKGAATGEAMSKIKELERIVEKLKNTDNTYRRSLQKLTESNKKLAKQVKNNKSKSALEQSMRVTGSMEKKD